jgi:hypothetical protein
MDETPAILRTKAAMARRLERGTLDRKLAARMLQYAADCEERAARLEQTQKQNPGEDT